MNTDLKNIREFIFDSEHLIYKHPDGSIINYQDGGESYILESIKKVHDLSSHSPEFKQYIKDWPSRYHFSNKRINFLEAMKEVLPENADVLEIGSGCGTITRWLGEQFHSVDALEGNAQRAGITRYRTKDLDNVKVYCGNLLATGFDKKYGIITLIGSLEYLPFYDTEYDDPKETCSAVLTRLKEALNEDGILLIAIENKFGAKYFSGCSEDHTGNEFEGIMGYPEKTPVTFSKNEIEEILFKSGLVNIHFYHVFPDYKVTETIIPENTEALSLYPHNWIRTPFEDYTSNRLNLYPDSLFLKSIIKSGLLWHFSNSFVILATKSKNANLHVDWLIKKYSNDDSHHYKFHHDITLVKNQTIISPEKKYIVKRSFLFNQIPNENNEIFEFQLTNNDFIEGDLLSLDFIRGLFKKSLDINLKQVLKKLHDQLLLTYSIGESDSDGYPLVKGEAVDYTFWNLIENSEKKLVFIDNKWRTKEPLSADLILFRNLFNFFDRISPYLKNKSKISFIIDMIQDTYPQYSEERLMKNLQFEEKLQSFVRGQTQKLPIDSPVRYSNNEQRIQNQELIARTLALEQQLFEKDQQLQITLNQIITVNQSLSDKDRQFQQTNSQIETLNKNINDVNLHTQDLEQSLSNRDIRIAELSNQVQQVTLHAQGLEQIIKEKRSIFGLSPHFELTERFIDASNYFLNTCRNSCKLGLKAFDILSHEGLRGLLKHYNDRKYIENFEKNKHKIQSFRKKEIIPVEKIDIKKILLPEGNGIPEVSIIIPVYNKVQYTLNCIRSISLNTNEPYEIIVIDDASTDKTPELLKSINNLTIIKNEQNRGFIRSCNIGAAASKGNYILFLNNDTLVTENWLPPLLEIIKKENVGAVGAKLVYPDGKLQEAGAIIWNDASGWNYGRGDNPEKPEYNFVREVDYCSGAALLVKKEIFEKTGGFDERYIPAYYEDADLCFSIRKKGYRVLYQPKSVIIHFEGISNGSDINKGVKQNQIINKNKFFQKWKEVLESENFNPSARNLILARSHSSGKNILVIDQYVPFFDRDAGSYRMNNILKILAELGHRVTFIGENFNQFEPYDSIMQQAGIEVIFSPFIQSIKQYISQNGQYFNIVILSRPHIAQKHISNIRKYCPNAKVVFDTVDLQFLRESRRAKVINNPVLLKKADELKKMEIELAKSSDVTLVVSTKEYEILISEDPSLNVQIISLIHDLKKPDKTFAERRDLLFLGAFLHNPNVDGVIWFIQEIFPKIKLKIPDIKLFVVGDRPTKEVLSFSSENIIVTGYVEDLTGYFNDCKVFVAPLRYGAGVKGKINQSMSHGLPVITTLIGAEGMDLTDEHNILIADEPDTFAKKVIQLYQDEELWNKFSINSTEHIRQNFSYEKSKNRIKLFIESL